MHPGRALSENKMKAVSPERQNIAKLLKKRGSFCCSVLFSSENMVVIAPGGEMGAKGIKGTVGLVDIS